VTDTKAKVRLQARTDNHTKRASPDISYAEAAAAPAAADNAVVDPEKAAPAPRKRTEGGAIPLLRAVYRDKGFPGWYQGLTAQILKAALCQGGHGTRPSLTPSDCRYPLRQQGPVREVGVGDHCHPDGYTA